MRSKKNVETVILKEGETLQQGFNTHMEMAKSAVDWTLFCSYQLEPGFLKGSYKILKLPSMQIAYTDMRSAVMFDYVSPKDSITFSVIQHVSKKACIDQMKLETGMIVVVDDKKIYNFMCSGEVELLDISFNKNTDPKLLKKLEQAVDKYYRDSDQRITKLIKGFVDDFGDQNTLNKKTSMKIERQIIEEILKLLHEQKVQIPHFSKSEKSAMAIKRQLFKHMDHEMTVSALAEQYHITAKSLQNGFRSLFDLTPNQFIRLLKLNLVHHELIQSTSSKTSVLRVAQKWGFRHMGRFSKYYTELFGENPSLTLKTINPMIDGIREHCVERKEEIS